MTDGVVGVGDLVVGLGDDVGGVGLVVVTVGVGDLAVGVVGGTFGLPVVLPGLAFVVGLTAGDVVVRFTSGVADVGTDEVAASDMLAMGLGTTAVAGAALAARVLGTAAIEDAAATCEGERVDADPLLLLDAPQALTTTEIPTPRPMRPNERVREAWRIRDSGGRGATRPGHVVHYGRPSATVQISVS